VGKVIPRPGGWEFRKAHRVRQRHPRDAYCEGRNLRTGLVDPDVQTEAEAIEIANDTEFGLIAYVSSADPERANRVARKLAAGRVLINTLSHDPFAPFGGFKQSGIGREGGIFGLQEYLEPKAIIG
jgi:hypothetical protein